MRSYEFIVVLSPKQDSQKTLEEVKALFLEYSTAITAEKNWGTKNLFHPMKDINKAVFVHMECQMNPKIIAELQREIKLNSNVLRFMIKSKSAA